MVKNIRGAPNSGTDILSLLENVRVDLSVFTVWHGLFGMSKERKKKSNNSIHPQGVNFNTVYYELQTDKIAAWIHTKMLFFFLSKFCFCQKLTPHCISIFCTWICVIKQTMPRQWGSSLWEPLQINQQNKHGRLEKHQQVKHYKFPPFSHLVSPRMKNETSFSNCVCGIRNYLEMNYWMNCWGQI